MHQNGQQQEMAGSVRPPTRDAGADAREISRVFAHVLDIELSEPVAGLGRTAPDGQQADRAWVLVRLLGEPLGLDVLDIPAAGLPPEAVEAMVLDRRLPQLCRILGIGEAGASHDTVRAALLATGGTALSRAHDEFRGRAPAVLGSGLHP